MKPLFIPLKTEYYRQFEAGTKTHEYRQYGKFNERTCAIGRPVILRRGYSTPDILSGTIVSFERIRRRDLPDPATYNSWLDCYGPEADDIADIRIEVKRG